MIRITPRLTATCQWPDRVLYVAWGFDVTWERGDPPETIDATIRMLTYFRDVFA